MSETFAQTAKIKAQACGANSGGFLPNQKIFFSKLELPSPQANLSKSPDIYNAFLDAKKLNKDKKYSEALKILEKVICSDYGGYEAQFQMGKAYYGLKRYEDALECFEYSLSIDKKPVTMLNIGWCLTELKKYEKAKSVLLDAFNLEPRDPLICKALGKACYFSSDFSNSLFYLAKFLESGQNGVDVYYLLAKTCLNLNKYGDARMYFDNAISLAEKRGLASSDHFYYSERGSFHAYLRKYQLAIADYKKALELDPGDACSHLRMGIVQYEIREYAKALESLQISRRIREGGEACYFLALVCHKMGKNDDSWEYLDAALRFEPGNKTYLRLREVFNTAKGAHITREIADAYIGHYDHRHPENVSRKPRKKSRRYRLLAKKEHGKYRKEKGMHPPEGAKKKLLEAKTENKRLKHKNRIYSETPGEEKPKASKLSKEFRFHPIDSETPGGKKPKARHKLQPADSGTSP